MTTVTATEQAVQVLVSNPVTTPVVSENAVTVTASEQAVTVTATEQAVSIVAQTSPVSITTQTTAVTVSAVTTAVTVTASAQDVTVVSVGTQGPPGVSAEDLSMLYRKLVDIEEDTPTAGLTTIYIGWASPGAGDGSAAVWKVQKLVLNAEDDITTSGFAPSALFNQVWDDRVSLVYS